MKLKTEKGELSLPNDFAFEVETTNPAFSDEGDATVPTTLPASSDNFKVLGNLHRIDRADRFMKRIPATLSAGTFFKKGQLIIDTIDKNNGIDVSFAIENSDIYSQYKNTSLKEIFKDKVRIFNSVAEIITLFESIYNNKVNDDFAIFQIAVSKYEDDKEGVVYQYNNEIDFLNSPPPLPGHPSHYKLVYEARTVREGDYMMAVPEGYGVSPFLYLHKMIDILFSLIGYDVVENCFSAPDLKDIVLLNNCADSIVESEIDYSDLVPSCTLTEFVEFLQEKFNAVLKFDSTKMQVRCVLVNDIIQNKGYDIDISNIVREDSLSMQVNETSRVILSSDYIDGGEPASETLDALIEKYGYCVSLDEGEFSKLLQDISIDESVAQCHDCLIFRSYTGGFYELRRKMNDGKQIVNYIGTSNFKYDRNNSTDSEIHSAGDIIPLMVETKTDSRCKLFPFIGDRSHRHTTVLSSKFDEDQDVILCWNHNGFGSITSRFYGEIKSFDLTPCGLYQRFWSAYNNLLLNSKVSVNAIVEYPKKYLLSIDMIKPKLYKNQLLIPVKTSYNVSSRISCGNSEFVLLKKFSDGVSDSEIEFLDKQPPNHLKWFFDDTALTAQASVHWAWYRARGLYVDKTDGHFVRPEPWPNDPYNHFEYNCLTLLIPESYTVERIPPAESAFIGPPSFDGECTFEFTMKYNIVVKYIVCPLDVAHVVYVPSSERRLVTYSQDQFKAQVLFRAVRS